jgi:hypothetical protein
MKKWRSRVTTDGLERAPHRAFIGRDVVDENHRRPGYSSP